MPGSIRSLEEEIAELEAQIYEQPEKEEEVEEPVDTSEEVVEEAPQKDPDPTPTPEDPEEGSFKKRYGDLRRHSQKLQEELKAKEAKIAELEKAGGSGLPSAEEAEEWAKANPKAAAIIRAIAVQGADPRTSEIEEIKEKLNRAEQEAKVLKSHPDFEEISESKEFHDWADRQPERIQEFIFSSNADDVIWAVDQFKRLKAAPQKPNTDAAKAVPVKSPANTPDTKKARFYESEVSKMTVSEFEKNEAAITQSQRDGTFVYDLSGAVR